MGAYFKPTGSDPTAFALKATPVANDKLIINDSEDSNEPKSITLGVAFGSGDVDGPSSSTDENITVFDSTTGKLIKDSGVNISTVIANAAKLTANTTNVENAGALMDSEVDTNIKTLVLPASTTISVYGASLIDDTDASSARSTLDVDQAGTDNSTDVTLVGTPDYLTISGQAITRNAIDLNTDITGNLSVNNLNAGVNADTTTYWRGDGTWVTPSDPTALHDNVAGEIAAITLKATPVANDKLIINDSEDSNEPKSITLGVISVFETNSNVTSNNRGNFATDDFVFGSNTRASGNFSFAAGNITKATALNSTAFGKGSDAGGDASVAMGYHKSNS